MKQQMKASAYTLSSAEIKKLLKNTSNFRDRCIIKSLYWLGLRRKELVELDIRDIDFERERVKVREGKGGKMRTVPIINDELVGDLKHLVGSRKSGPVFMSNKEKRIGMRTVNLIVETLGEKAGIDNPNPARKHLNPHLFRHSIARHLKSKGFSAEWLKEFLGHQSYETTMDEYGTIGIDEMEEVAAAKLAE